VRTLKTLKPGQRGTKDLLARYGATLLYVRYRCGEDTGEGWKTVDVAALDEVSLQRKHPLASVALDLIGIWSIEE